MNTTPQGERIRIVLAGRCNVGKSSLINALAGQPVAIVSEERGTTTDPVRKAMELLPLGPVLLCDTAGLDDTTPLGIARQLKTEDEIKKADIVLLVVDASKYGEKSSDESVCENKILKEVQSRDIPCIVVANKCDTTNAKTTIKNAVAVSASTGLGIDALKETIIKTLNERPDGRHLVSGLVAAGDVVVLVTPIDKAAPKGRLILPQQQVIRDILDIGAIPIVVRDTELTQALTALKSPPDLVITDSQAFSFVEKNVPADVPLTSFSILFARYKGNIDILTAGARAVASLHEGDRILIAEGCTHHRQDDDIGTVKIPRLLQKKTGKNFIFEHCSGLGYPKDLNKFALIVHCGACMLGRREMMARINEAINAGVPIVNYGILLAELNGILEKVKI